MNFKFKNNHTKLDELNTVVNYNCNSPNFLIISISIYNTIGELIFEDKGKLMGHVFQKEYDLSYLPKGNYLVKVICDNGSQIEKLVIQ